MLILTVIYLVLSISVLFRGGLLYNFSLEIIEMDGKIKSGNITSSESDKYKGKLLGFVLFSIIYIITLIIYYLMAFNLDPLKYPTVIMVILTVFPAVNNLVKSKNKNDKERIKPKKHTFKQKVISLINIAYYTYILYVLMTY